MISDDVISKSLEARCYKRDFTVVSNEDSKVILCTKASFNMVLSVYKMDRERVC